MRTVKVIKSEAEKALIEYNEHVNNCELCQFTPHYEGETLPSCYESEWLHEAYQSLIGEADYAEQVFQEELKDRDL